MKKIMQVLLFIWCLVVGLGWIISDFGTFAIFLTIIFYKEIRDTL